MLLYKNNIYHKRIIGIDIIRTIAIFSIIAGHFFSINTFYKEEPFEGISMFIQGCFSVLFYIGVPLFMMMTGYLNCNKIANKKYYRGITNVLIAYIFFSIITILFRCIYLKDNKSFLEWTLSITNYSAIPYAWYIEMWIGLFLLTPFLNRLYKAIPSQKEKIVGLVTLYILVALPEFFNRYGLYLMPAYWIKAAYPLLFFFTGTFIKEFQPSVSRVKGIILIIMICITQPCFNIIFFKEHSVIEILGGPCGIFVPFVALTVFLLCYQLNISNKYIRCGFKRCAILSLNMYLSCYIFDELYYAYFINNFYVNQSQFGLYFLIIIPLVFISSFLTSWIYESIYNRLHIL